MAWQGVKHRKPNKLNRDARFEKIEEVLRQSVPAKIRVHAIKRHAAVDVCEGVEDPFTARRTILDELGISDNSRRCADGLSPGDHSHLVKECCDR